MLFEVEPFPTDSMRQGLDDMISSSVQCGMIRNDLQNRSSKRSIDLVDIQGVEASIQSPDNYAPVKFAFRFSMKALVPSLKSAVPKHLPNSSISRWRPFTPGS